MKKRALISTLILIASQPALCSPVDDIMNIMKNNSNNASENSQNLPDLNGQHEPNDRIQKEQAPKPKLEDNPNAQATWTDPSTQLIWSTCYLGQAFDTNTGECKGYRADIDWADAMMMAKKANLYGFNDWRVPTAQEYKTALKRKDIGAPSILSYQHDRLWASTLGKNSATDVVIINTDFEAELIDADRLKGNRDIYNGHKGVYSLLVRGGTSNGDFEKGIILAQSDLDMAQKAAQALADKARKRQEDSLRQQQAAIEMVAKFQKNIKVGDYTKQGLVIAIKGSLIKVQQYGKQCIEYFQNSGGCYKWQKFVAGEAWVNRSELLPQDNR